MGQKLDRVIHDKATCIAWVSEIYRNAAHFGSTHQTVLDSLAKMREHKEYKRLPGWARQVVSQHNFTLFDSLYDNTLDGRKPCLMSVLIGPDGAHYAEGNDAWLAQTTEYKQAMRTEYYWRVYWELGLRRCWSNDGSDRERTGVGK